MLMSTNILGILSNHIALPAQLPGCQDDDPNQIEIQLIHRLSVATSKILEVASSDHKNVWNSLYHSLLLTFSVHANEGLSKSEIISAIQSLNNHDFVLFHVTEQNTGLTVTLQKSKNEENLLFELSEASPRCEDVLASSNTLLWEFPNSAVSIPVSSYNEYDLEDELANFLVQASDESVKDVAPHTKKANSLAYESRDTVDPILISGILMTFLKNKGTNSYPPLLTKRVRDDVCWDGSGVNPWRRSPMWLLLRVATEKHLCEMLGWQIGHLYYKLLMCLFHSLFLAEYTKSSSIKGDVLQHITRKLVIRIDKLHDKDSKLKSNLASQFIELYNALEDTFHDSVECARKRLLALIHVFKVIDIIGIQHNPPIHRIRFRLDEKYYKLQLLNSDRYISNSLSISGCKIPSLATQHQNNVSILSSAPSSTISAIENYIELAEFESKIESSLQQHQSENKSHETCDSHGQDIAHSIEYYLENIGISYQDNSEQKSKMLLIVLELWVELDKCTIQSFSLLKSFSPGIPQEITNVLLLSRLEDLERLNQIRNYLITRQKDCGNSSLTIFDQPSENCFAVQYYNNLPKTSIMKKSHIKIKNDSQTTRKNKINEWHQMNIKFQLLQSEESNLTHVLTRGEHDYQRCTKCYKKRVIKRFRMQIHEWPLPSDTFTQKTILFELHCPASFSIYRDISWMILIDLASNTVKEVEPLPEFLLSDYNALFKYSTTSKGLSRFTLASKAKSFMTTHYANVKFPAREVDVCLPSGAKFQYFDKKNKIWPSKLSGLSFAHHCSLNFPEGSPFFSFSKILSLKIDTPDPSSYAVVASCVKCPTGVPIHEFSSMQTLLSGFRHRWLQILIEMGSSNINFSTESTSCFMNFLSLQVGPRDEEDVRGIIHCVFLDQGFCSRLIYWINWRLDEISSIVRKRDVFHMEILITLAIRLFELGGPSHRVEGYNILTKVRNTTLNWLSELKKEIKASDNNETSQKLALYVIWTSLLCRRTFVVFIGLSSIPHDLISSYLESSISLQEHLNDDNSALSISLKAALIRDAKMIWSLRRILRESIHLKALTSVLLAHMPSLDLSETLKKTPLQYQVAPRDWWVEIVTKKSEKLKQQHINFNILTGHLLIDGKPIGKLPKKWRESKIYKRLFGTEVIHIWSSQLSGMDYVLDQKRYEHEIHFGTKNGIKERRTSRTSSI
ncbi:putative p-loop containing nucleoside triphosphate hydrolase [Erysiphe neolycopersici]|uniref:Putative p-loop containing nucleoside triphosphate hydrolase n=1 Tax=Erysiphe neolycopersici TaxID=212602 RepID=A0A420I876_9PEZI|nr:putative p-loop containing nucleoside triphosphate hydrolase [Erysiphe neolycopersici]